MAIQRRTWRIIYSEPTQGAWNMAVDEAILESAGKGLAPPTLRLYAWEPPCLSLGIAQPVSDVNQAELEARGWQLVRRPTGGRAILHTDELTYAVIGSQDEPVLAGSVLESYRALARGLLRALELLGIPAVAAELPRAVESGGEGQVKQPEAVPHPVCFIEPTHYEITVGGKKLVGSAQARRGNAVLQHGSLPLHGDLGRIVRVLRFADPQSAQEAVKRLLERATTVAQVLGKEIKWEEAAAAFRQGFEAALELKFEPGSLTLAEAARLEELMNHKYSSPEWNNRI